MNEELEAIARREFGKAVERISRTTHEKLVRANAGPRGGIMEASKLRIQLDSMEEICHELARIWTELLEQKNAGHLTRDDLNFIMSKVRETASARKSHLTSGPNTVSGLASAAGEIEKRISGITASINRDHGKRVRRLQAFAKQ